MTAWQKFLKETIPSRKDRKLFQREVRSWALAGLDRLNSCCAKQRNDGGPACTR